MVCGSNCPAFLDGCDLYTFDTTHFNNLLAQNAKRLFVTDDSLQIKVVEIGNKDLVFTNLVDFEGYLHNAQCEGTRIILIPQPYSWGRLTISETALRTLLGHLNVFPAFIDVLCAFGQLTSESTDSLGGCYMRNQYSLSELCYLIKHVEQHGREDSDEPWSIRQLGVYHQHDKVSRKHTFVLLNPTLSIQQRLKIASTTTRTQTTPQDLHTLACSHATWQWRWYLNHWESKLAQLVSKAHVSRVQGRQKTDRLPVVTIEYSDFQDVQVIHDRMNVAKFILNTNARVCEVLRNESISPSNMNLFSDELELQSSRVDNLLERTRSGSSLMQNIISFRGLDALRNSSENSNEMARLAELDNKNMVKLTVKSQRDAETLKKITILTMIYLPASFVAQFLSMGYVKINSKQHPASLNLSSEMWIFAILTVVLLAITMGLWWYLDGRGFAWGPRCRRKSRQDSADEKI